jgi:hypothetical protein
MIIRSVIIALILTIVLPGYAENYYAAQDESTWENVSSEDILTGTETFTAGTVVSYLPNGARSILIEQNQYFISGGNWFLPVIKEDRVAFLVVFAPI